MAVKDDTDFRRLAQFAKDNPNHPRRAEIIAELRRYDEQRKANVQVDTPQEPTDFGQRVLNASRAPSMGRDELRDQVNQAIQTAEPDSPLAGLQPIPDKPLPQSGQDLPLPDIPRVGRGPVGQQNTAPRVELPWY